MKKMFIVFAALVLIAVGYAIGTIAPAKQANAMFGSERGGTPFIHYPSRASMTVERSMEKETIERLTSNINALREELEMYKWLEAFWSTETIRAIQSKQLADDKCDAVIFGRAGKLM